MRFVPSNFNTGPITINQFVQHVQELAAPRVENREEYRRAIAERDRLSSQNLAVQVNVPRQNLNAVLISQQMNLMSEMEIHIPRYWQV